MYIFFLKVFAFNYYSVRRFLGFLGGLALLDYPLILPILYFEASSPNIIFLNSFHFYFEAEFIGDIAFKHWFFGEYELLLDLCLFYIYWFLLISGRVKSCLE